MNYLLKIDLICIFFILSMTAITITNGSSALAQNGQKTILTLDHAKRMAAVAEASAKKLKAPGGAFAIVDDGGHLIFLERLDGTFPASASVSFDKAHTAATFQKPTRVFEEAIKNGRVALTGVKEMTPLQGGVPIRFEGQIIGAIGVSGASSQQQDDEIATIAAESLNSDNH